MICKNKIFHFLIVLFLIFTIIFNEESNAVDSLYRPVTIDNRIRTLVYSPNEIFRLKFRLKYQSIIELSQDETLELISLGDPYPWKIKPVGKMIFIKALDPGMQTNMIIVTSKRTYLLEISSTYDDSNFDDDLMYIVRFYYPEPILDMPIISQNKGSISGKLTLPSEKRDSIDQEGANFRYSFAGSGGKNVRPVKVFDNGKKTYFMFANKNERVPMIYAVSKNGKEELLDYKIQGDYIVVDTTEYQYAVRMGKELICIFNEKYVKIEK